MRGAVGQAYDEIRAALAEVAEDILPDKCRLIVGSESYADIPCKLVSNGGEIDGAPYQIRFAWSSPAVIGAAVVLDAISGRPQLTLQIVEPLDSSTDLWQEWSARSGPGFGRHNVGL